MNIHAVLAWRVNEVLAWFVSARSQGFILLGGAKILGFVLVEVL